VFIIDVFYLFICFSQFNYNEFHYAHMYIKASYIMKKKFIVISCKITSFYIDLCIISFVFTKVEMYLEKVFRKALTNIL